MNSYPMILMDFLDYLETIKGRSSNTVKEYAYDINLMIKYIIARKQNIKLKSFDFMKCLELEKLELLWNSNNDLDDLKDLKSLKEIGLWRISKLDNIDFISELINLEIIKLQDLKYITELPDLSGLTKLKKIVLDGTSIKIDAIDEPYKSMVERYWI